MHDKVPRHAARSVTSWLMSAIVRLLPWPGNAPHMRPYIENTWQHIKDKIATQQPSSMPELIEAIKHIWVFEISREYFTVKDVRAYHDISNYSSEIKVPDANTEAATLLLLFAHVSVLTVCETQHNLYCFFLTQER